MKVPVWGKRRVEWKLDGYDPVVFVRKAPVDKLALMKFVNGIVDTGPPPGVAGAAEPTLHVSLNGALNKATAAQAAAMVGLAVSIVEGWEGVAPSVEDQGEAPCTEDSRREFFSRELAAAIAVTTDVMAELEEERARKNGSRGGSGSGKPTPPSLAASPTATGRSVPATDAEHELAVIG